MRKSWIALALDDDYTAAEPDGSALPDELWHYTDPDGFRGILTDKQFWATDLLHMNDATELAWGRRIIREAAKKREESLATERVRTVLDLCRHETTWSIFGLSFSAQENDLAQWRAYARNGGYAIVLDREALDALRQSGQWAIKHGDEHDRHLDSAYLFGQVEYDEERQLSRASALLDQLAEKVDIPENVWTPNAPNLARVFSKHEITMSAFMKHPKFSGEKEWRLISRHHWSPIDFRVTRSLLSPFRRMCFDSGDIVLTKFRVVVGPTPHPALAERAARQLLDRTMPTRARPNAPVAPAAARVKLCGIPFVNW